MSDVIMDTEDTATSNVNLNAEDPITKMEEDPEAGTAADAPNETSNERTDETTNEVSNEAANHVANELNTDKAGDSTEEQPVENPEEGETPDEPEAKKGPEDAATLAEVSNAPDTVEVANAAPDAIKKDAANLPPVSTESDTNPSTEVKNSSNEDHVDVVVVASAAGGKEDSTIVADSEPMEGVSIEQASEPAIVATATQKEVEVAPTESEIPVKENKKRVRRVGRTPTRKIPKLDEKELATPSTDVSGAASSNVDTAGTPAVVTYATAPAIGSASHASGAAEPSSTVAIASPSPPNQGVLSKHDEKWYSMFQKLIEFKETKKHTLVPQCYTADPRLGRWVHYQRVEYWIFQQKGSAKITEERIARLNAIGFEWDPQKAQWEKMFAKLKEFKKEFSHCRVPKGYDKDWELANWVRNQRLEQANLSKEGKKSRMTPERFKLLDELGFKWSSPTPARARRNSKPLAVSAKKNSNSAEATVQKQEVKAEQTAGVTATPVVDEKPPDATTVAVDGKVMVTGATDAVVTNGVEGELEDPTKLDAGNAKDPSHLEAAKQVEI